MCTKQSFESGREWHRNLCKPLLPQGFIDRSARSEGAARKLGGTPKCGLPVISGHGACPHRSLQCKYLIFCAFFRPKSGLVCETIGETINGSSLVFSDEGTGRSLDAGESCSLMIAMSTLLLCLMLTGKKGGWCPYRAAVQMASLHFSGHPSPGRDQHRSASQQKGCAHPMRSAPTCRFRVPDSVLFGSGVQDLGMCICTTRVWRQQVWAFAHRQTSFACALV